jgi:hypothetical protein
MKNPRGTRHFCDLWYQCDRDHAWWGAGFGMSAILATLISVAVVTGVTASIAVPGAPGIRVFPAPEVLAKHTFSLPEGGIAFRDAAGAEIPLIRDPRDPQIANRGDGGFHPADVGEVLATIAQVPEPFLAALRVDIYLLPYPRSGMLASSADVRAIYITPGVVPYDPAQIAFLVAHELGHCAHRRFLPDTDAAGWTAWAALRGTADSSLFPAGAPHASCPHEIFAEDFRVLFGGPVARGDGSVENAAIPRPEDVPGLRDFYLGLAGEPIVAAVEWTFGPNPIPDGRQGVLRAPEEWTAADIRAELFDAAGRLVAAPDLRPGGSATWSVDFSSRKTLPSGAYWLRLSSPRRPAIPLPLRVTR